MILYVAIEVFKDAVDKMLDTSCDESFENELKDFVLKFADENACRIGVDLLRTRKFGERIYVDIEINADGDMTLKEAHAIAENLHDAIENAYEDIKHVMVHVNPAGYIYKVQD